jgi:hypothetical protein
VSAPPTILFDFDPTLLDCNYEHGAAGRVQHCGANVWNRMKQRSFHGMNSAQSPKQESQTHPRYKRGYKSRGGIPITEDLPSHETKGGQPQASHGSAPSIESRRFATATSVDDARLLLLLNFVFFHQRRARGENSWKRQEQPTHNRPEVFGDKSGCHRYNASKKKRSPYSYQRVRFKAERSN